MKHHYFNLTFGAADNSQRVSSRIVRFDHARISNAQLNAIRHQENIDDRSPLMSVSYLGGMTVDQWEEELWGLSQVSTPRRQNGGGFVGSLLLIVILLTVAVTWLALW